MPRAIEISEENLEDLLAYDDLFLDYFNAFLALPVFPQPLYYNRLTGLFEDVPPVVGANSVTDEKGLHTPPPYGATDEERDRMLQWAKEERLPIFLRTQLFLELKLCKLLLRPLDERFSARRRGSHQTLRGYSRQTETYASSLSNSADNSANGASDLDDDASVWGMGHKAMLFKYQRPGSRAVSLPPRLQFAPPMSAGSVHVPVANYMEGWRQGSGDGNRGRRQQNGAMVSALRNVVQQGTTPAGPSRDVTFDDRTETFGAGKAKELDMLKPECHDPQRSKPRSGRRASQVTSGDQTRVVSAPADGEEFPRVPTCSDFDVVFGEDEPDVADGEAFVAFADDIVSDSQTETDVRNLEGKHMMTIQEMKEQVLGCVGGQQAFRTFLAGTTGEHLYNFWLDCEYFKDTMEEYDEEELNAYRNRLFRDIQDKYKLNLTGDAKKQILAASSSTPVSHTVFIRTQYDVLRRLRVYWLPRFLIHKERLDELSEKLRPTKMPVNVPERPVTSFFFPSISLVNSMPVNPEDLLQIAVTTSWDMVSKGGRRLDDRIKSAKFKISAKPPQQSMREKLVQALSSDKAAGGPFKTFLVQHQDSQLLSVLLFWEDVTEYSQAEDRLADRLLRRSHAWTIFNTYIAVGCKHPIGVDPSQQDKVHSLLLTSKDFVDSGVFNSAKIHAVEMLEKSWIRYLKEDAKKYYDCHMRNTASPATTAEDYEVMVDDNENLIVRRPRPWVRRYPPSTCSERGERLRTALSLAESIDEARRIEQRRRAKERRKITERERKKAIRNARQRQRDAKRNVSFKPKPEVDMVEGVETEHKTAEEEAAPGEEAQETNKATDFIGSITNKGVISLFKKYLTENEGRDLVNIINLYLDIEAYNTITAGDKGAKTKKESHAAFINKTYLEQGARKRVLMSEKVYSKLKAEKDRPKSPTLKEAQAHILPQLEETFKKFWESQAEELGVDGKSLANMSKAELALRADNDPSLLTGWKKRGRGTGKWTSADESNHLQFPPLVKSPNLLSETIKEFTSMLENITDEKILLTAVFEPSYLFSKLKLHAPSMEALSDPDVIRVLSGLVGDRLTALSTQSWQGHVVRPDVDPGIGWVRDTVPPPLNIILPDNMSRAVQLDDIYMTALNLQRFPYSNQTSTHPSLKAVSEKSHPNAKTKIRGSASKNLMPNKYGTTENLSGSWKGSVWESDSEITSSIKMVSPPSRPFSNGTATASSPRLRSKKTKADGRAQPTKEDRMEFLVALSAASSGHFPLQMLYFYKYLMKHGQEDGFPLIDKDLFFYCEVQKFKDASHQFADEELLRRKVQAIVECYLDSSTPPTLQVDIPGELQQKTIRTAQRYLSGKDLSPGLFDEAQYVVFKDLLPYWAGFGRTFKAPEDEQKRPLTKQERERKKRLEEFVGWKPPSAQTFSLPSLPKGTTVAAMTFSLTEGVKWREGAGEEERTFGTTPDTTGRKFGSYLRRGSVLSNVDSVSESQQSSIYA